MIELQLDRDQASILCDALTEWSMNHMTRSAWERSDAKKQRNIKDALLSESLRDTVRAKMDGEAA